MATYYVAKTGSDDNAGTLAAPWLTIAYAATQLSAGDTLYIRAGTYVEEVNFEADGTSASPIVIDNYPGETVIIDGEYTIPSNHLYFLVEVLGDYTTIRDITIKRSNGALLVVAGTGSTAYNITGEGSKESGIIGAGTGATLDSCTMTGNGSGYGIDGQGSWGSAIATVGADTVIKDCIAWENYGEGLNAYSGSSNATIQDCVSYDNQHYNLYADSASGMLIQRNLVYQTKSAYDMYGITIGAETGQPSGVKVYNNFVMGCKVNFHVDSNVTTLSGVDVAFNTFVNSTGNTGEGYNMGVYFRSDPTSYEYSYFRNNVVIEEEPDKVPVYVETSHDGLTFSYNCWSKAAIAEAQGTGDVTGDPKISKTGSTAAGELAGEYFTLLYDSPAIGAGIDMPEVKDDYFGNGRRNPPSIGGYEYPDPTMVTSDNYTLQISDTATLAQIHTLVADEGFQICVSDQATLLAGAALVADENYQVQFSENAILTSTGQLIAYENDQFQYSDEAVLWTGDLIADENYQTQVSDNASLGATEGPTIIFNLYGPIRIICTGIQTTENAPEMPPREINKVYQE